MKNTVLLALMIALLAACNYAKPGMYVTLTNSSGITLRNIEVDYPGGIYGMASLANDQTNRRLVQLSPPCTFTIKFDTDTVKTEPHKFDFGDACPKEIVFTVDNTLSVTRRIAQP